MSSTFIRIKTKFIIFFSVLITVILLIQFYFMDKTQNEIVQELQTMSTRINAATDLIYVDTDPAPDNVTVSGRIREIKKPMLYPPKAVAILEEDDNEFTVRVESIERRNAERNILKPGQIIRKTRKDLKKDLEKIGQDNFIVDIREDAADKSNDMRYKTYSWVNKEDSFLIKSGTHSYIFNEKGDDSDSVETIIAEIHANLPGPKHREFSFFVPNLVSQGGPRFVRYNYNTEKFHDTLEKSRNRNIIITLLLLGLSIVGITFIARNFEKPIHDLRDSFSKVVGGDLDAHVEVISNDEVGELAGSFNLMVDELRKNREKEKLLNRKERLAALGQLAAGVAHEIRNPLNAINLTITHLGDKFVDKADNAAIKYVQTIQQEIKRLEKTVNDFLNYVRSDSLEKESSDIKDLLEEVCNLYEREIKHNQIELLKDFGSKFKMKVDAERLKTAMINIVLNAIQSMPTGGKLAIITRPRKKEIIFRDTGKGIAEKDLNNIFDLFFTTKSTGTGLGLPTAYKIIKAHHGEILIDSKEGAGTTITIHFETEQR